MTWETDQVSNIISFFSAAGTIGALLYAYHLERKNSKKINDLGNIVTELRDQNEMFRLQFKDEAAPKFEQPKAKNIGGDYITISILNSGKRAKIGRIKCTNSEFEIGTSGKNVLSNEEFVLYCSAPNKDLRRCSYRISFEYFDIYGNQYAMVITGQGDIITSWSPFDTFPTDLF